jgi:hypothetical protein
LRGEKLGEYFFSERTQELWGFLAAPELLDSVVESVEARDGAIWLRIQVSSI